MLLFLVLFLVSVESTYWYAAHDLSQKDSSYFIEKECFRGRYLGGLSLLTCGFEGAQFITELPDKTPLCVVELSRGNHEQAIEAATRSGEASVIYSSRQSLVLAAKSDVADYPTPCREHADYEGLADNVILVPSSPVHPEVFIPTQRSTAPDPKITRLLDMVSSSAFNANLTMISNFHTRHSQSNGNNNLPGAIDQLVAWYRSHPGWTVQTQSLNRSGYNNPNIMATRTGTRFPNQSVVFGAHLDDRNNVLSDNTGRAPGADDNGSGTVAVLELARLISQLNYTFQYTLVLAHFTGEEQGLYGSQRMAQVFKSQGNTSVIAMYNVDMLAYNQTTTPAILGLTNSSGRMSPTLLSECINVFREYLPIQYGTSTACCSDQQSFQNEGFPSMSFFETNTANVIYPQYHTAQDMTNATGFSVSQNSNYGAKAAYACALTKALIN
jgi:hypothetical protein